MNDNTEEFLQITRIKEEFIANASHELKTPVASVRLAAESALRSLKLNDGMAKSFLEQILRDSDRMNELISDLLDLSLMETSDIEMEVIDLHDVISNEISYLSKQNNLLLFCLKIFQEKQYLQFRYQRYLLTCFFFNILVFSLININCIHYI